jgi:superfamily II DNA or RNA helicase
MACATNIIERRKYAKKMGISEKIVMANAMGFMKAMKARKDFVMSHPKKIEIARKILNARKNHKCITFSATIKDAEKLSFKNEFVLHSKKSKKQNHETIENFNSASIGVLHSSKAADCGVDVKGLSVGIILSTDSSKIRKTQRNGRICRFEDGKTAELFTLLIKGTQEVN